MSMDAKSLEDTLDQISIDDVVNNKSINSLENDTKNDKGNQASKQEVNEQEEKDKAAEKLKQIKKKYNEKLKQEAKTKNGKDNDKDNGDKEKLIKSKNKKNKKGNKKKMKKIDLSVIIPVYNTEKYLKKCIDSVILACKKIRKELKKNSEIIIINDGSKGNADEIINEYFPKYKNMITYVSQENIGIAVTRNKGIKLSKGDYISFIDSDDYIVEDYYLDAFKVIMDKDSDIVIFDVESINEDGTSFITTAKEDKEIDDKWGCFDVSIMPMPCNKIIKRQLYKELEFPDGYLYEDLATIPIVMLRAQNIVYISKASYKYLLRKNSTMRLEFDEKKFKIIDVLKILFYRIDVLNNISRDYKQRVKVSIYYDRLFYELLEPLSQLNKEKRKKLIKNFCKQIQKLHENMAYNKYYKIKLNQGRIKKQFFDNLMDFALYNNLPGLLNLILDKLVFYNKQYLYDEWSRKDAEKYNK